MSLEDESHRLVERDMRVGNEFAVTVLSPAGIFDESIFEQIQVDVTVISWAGNRVEGITTIEIPRPSARWSRTVERAQRSLFLRVLSRLGPWEPAVAFWKATKRSSEATRRIAQSELLIAPERDGAYAAWRWSRRAARKGRVLHAVSGYPAARPKLEVRSV